MIPDSLPGYDAWKTDYPEEWDGEEEEEQPEDEPEEWWVRPSIPPSTFRLAA